MKLDTIATVVLQDLVPHTKYVVIVVCIPLIAQQEKGSWSNPSLLEFSTSPDGINIIIIINIFFLIALGT
jgi:hypothetical protein